MSNVPSTILLAGDLVSFKFPYSEGISPYARPCLVLEVTDDELLIAYGTTSRERANTGFEIRVNAEFKECGLDRESRFVLARRVRVSHCDPRFDPNALGTPVLGHLTEPLQARATDLLAWIKESWPDDMTRVHAERRGVHPRRGTRRRYAATPFRV